MVDFRIPEGMYQSQGWLAPIAKGYGLVNQMQMDQYKQNLLGQEVEKGQAEQAGLKQFGQTGDIKGLMGVDPAKAAMAAKVYDWYQTQKDPVQKDITRLTENLPSLAPMMNSKSWSTLRPTIKKSYPNIPDEALPPENATDQQLFQWANAGKLLVAQIKQSVASAPVPLVGPSGQPMGTIPGNAKVAPASAMPTTYYDPRTLEPRATLPPGAAMAPKDDLVWFGNPDNPKEGGWVKKGDVPPNPNWVPQGQVITLGKEQQRVASKEEMARMLINNEAYPDMVSGRGMDKNEIIALAKKMDSRYDPAKQNLQWYGSKRWLSSLSSTQQGRLEAVGVRVDHTVDEVRALTEQLNGKAADINTAAKQAPPNLGITGVGPINKAKLDWYIKFRGNTPEGQLATKYVTATNDLKEIFAQAASGGYAPTEPVWKLADKQINENFGIDQMKSSLDEIQKLVKINVNASREMRTQAMQGPGAITGQQPQGGGGQGGKTLVGTTPDGRQVYQDAQGNKFVAR